MQINPTLSLISAQMGFTSRVASDAATGPEATLAMSRAIAQEMAKLEQDKVQTPDPTTESRVTDENVDENGHNRQFAREQRGKKEVEEEEEEQVRTSADPMVGNLLNIKI